MFWSGSDWKEYRIQKITEVSELFCEYPKLVEIVRTSNKGFPAAFQLMQLLSHRAEQPDAFAMEESDLELELKKICYLLERSSAIDSRSCLEISDSSFDSTPYVCSSDSKISNSDNALVGNALDLISNTSYVEEFPAIHDTVIFLLDKKDFPDTNESYTIAGFDHSIFIDLYSHPLLTAESIVHELAHLQLNLYFQQNKLLDNLAGHEFYSPWKETNRPVANFIHSVVAFCDVISFLSELRDICPDKPAQVYLDMKIPFEIKNIKSILPSVEASLDILNDDFLSSRIDTLVREYVQ